MCLALIAWQSHPDYPLVVAANRDEFYTRATRPAAWWGQAVSLLAGRDEEAGGTWLGINRRGRFAMLTNVRAPSERNPHAPTRGALVVSALQSGEPIAAWLQGVAARAHVYNGFNLLVGDAVPAAAQAKPRAAELHYHSNRLGDAARRLEPGIYGLSNGFLDTPWPKVTRAVGRFACQLANRVDPDTLLALMADRALAPDSALPSTGVPLEWERVLSAIQIRANGYGTRTTTVISVRNDGLVSFVERAFDSDEPDRHTDRRYEFVIGTPTKSSFRLRTRADDA
jgi:uncharacterized protein with NRDE domain